MLDRVAASHLSPDEVLIQIYEDPNIPPDLRFKAASKVADLVYPKAASVEVKIEEENVIKRRIIECTNQGDFMLRHLHKGYITLRLIHPRTESQLTTFLTLPCYVRLNYSSVSPLL